ncbi:UNVERIFIED_CONTAM: putative isomerase [Sesamum calycinum]|uniref:Isomerase n=1 Tax=Sesamum calycinum TaxID=2727403 RepID=A0AAW2SAJ2_9LAMI
MILVCYVTCPRALGCNGLQLVDLMLDSRAVSNRRSRRWINDRLLMELVPRLNAEEIRGLFAPPPWGDDVPPSPFCMTSASIMKSLESSSAKQRDRLDADKVAALTAWHRVDSRTREALRRCYLSDLINGYEPLIAIISFRNASEHSSRTVGTEMFWCCMFKILSIAYYYTVLRVTESKGSESSKTTRIKKKQSVSPDLPNITLSNFLKMAKEGFWHGWGTDRGIIVTGPAPSGSGYDFYTRFFCPKLGADEDHLSSLVLLLLLISSSQFIMAKKPVRYCVVDAFTDRRTRVTRRQCVCWRRSEMRSGCKRWRVSSIYRNLLLDSVVRFGGVPDRFCPQVKLCGHATLAASHFLFAYNLVKSHTIEFLTLSGILTAKRVPETKVLDLPESLNGNSPDSFFIELDFPVVPVTEYDGTGEVSAISKSLGGASVNEIHKTTTDDDLIVVLPSGETVAEVEPNFGEIQKCPGRGIVITGLAPAGSGFDFFSRFFCPKLGIAEDPVCGSAHCALAPYWSKKLGKSDLLHIKHPEKWCATSASRREESKGVASRQSSGSDGGFSSGVNQREILKVDELLQMSNDTR